MVATEKGYLEVVKKLIKAGAVVGKANMVGGHSLLWIMGLFPVLS